MTNLKRLNQILTEGGPSYNKMKMALEEWKIRYENRNASGDINVIKFLEWFLGE